MIKGIESFKGRQLEGGERVKVYFDLHRKTFSVQKGALVYGKTDHVLLVGATFKVNEKDRQKVLETRTKNVHAKVHGVLMEANRMSLEELQRQGFREATYNPYFYDSFVDKETKQPIYQAHWAFMQDKRIYYIPVND